MRLAEWLPLKKVAVRSPGSAVASQTAIDGQWRDLNYLTRPVLEDAEHEHSAFRAALESAGVEVVNLSQGTGLTFDSVYARDTGLPSPRGMILTCMGKGARRHEPECLGRTLLDLDQELAGKISAPGMLEGGDCVWIDADTLLVGRTYRTNDEGIRQLKDILEPSVRIHVFQMPHYKGPGDVFHLMSVISPVDEKIAVCYPPLMPVPLVELLAARGVRMVEVPDDEFDSMGCNVLALGRRRIVMVENNPKTSRLLKDAGLEVTEISGIHICHPGQGGPTCLTLPMLRLSD